MSDVSTTAQAASVVASSFPLWTVIAFAASHVAAFFGGMFAKKPDLSKVTAALQEAANLAPAAEEAATLIGKPELAAGIQAGAGITQQAIQAVTQIHAAGVQAQALPTPAKPITGAAPQAAGQ